MGRGTRRVVWPRYVAAVATEKLAAAGRPPTGLRGSLTSDLPAGAGLSSSAALEVVLARCARLRVAAELELPALEVALLCQRAEHRAVGVPSGIMDQAASLLGEPDRAVLIDTGTLEHETVPLPGRDPAAGRRLRDQATRTRPATTRSDAPSSSAVTRRASGTSSRRTSVYVRTVGGAPQAEPPDLRARRDAVSRRARTACGMTSEVIDASSSTCWSTWRTSTGRAPRG